MKFYLISILLIISLSMVLADQKFIKKAKRQDRVCPPYNICGDGECFPTQHPSFQYQFVCRCRDGTYQFEPCKTTTVGATCSATSCSNGATCVLYSSMEPWCSPSQVGGTCCRCLPGYKGLRCEIDIDECASNPCRNFGVCDNLVNAYRCRCPSGFSGVNCEIVLQATTTTSTTVSQSFSPCALRPCGSFPCLESQNFANGYICQCGMNDFRPNCISLATTTTTTPTAVVTSGSGVSLCPDQSVCKNQGVCYVVSGTLRCVCPQGFSGIFCEIASNSVVQGCNPTPCRNSGTCISNTDGSFRGCVCPSGYGGTFCETSTGGTGTGTGTGTGSTSTCTKDGRFSDPSLCLSGKYIECVYVGQPGYPNGIRYVRDCAAGLRYDARADRCDYAANVPC